MNARHFENTKEREMAKVCVEYMYRDASNYKNWGEAILKNSRNESIDQLERRIRGFLHDCEFFEAKNAGITPLYFDKWISSQDHTWHTFLSLSTTAAEVTVDLEIEDFIDNLAKLKRSTYGMSVSS